MAEQIQAQRAGFPSHWLITGLANLVLVAALLPYLSPAPLRGTDAQPTATIISAIAIFLLFLLFPGRINVTRTDLVLIGLALLMLFYVDFSRTDADWQWLRTCGSLLVAFPVYYAVRLLYPHMRPKVMIAVVVAYLGVLIFQLTFPTTYMAIFQHLLSEIRWEVGVRGPNGLCIEPSMLGNMAVIFILATYFFHPEYWEKRPRHRHWVAAISILILIISQSASGIVLAMLVGAVGLLFSRRRWFFKVAVAMVFLLAVITAGTLLRSFSTRGAAFVSALAESPLVIVQDASFALRTVGTFIALYAVKDAPFGTGTLQFDQQLTDKAWQSPLMLDLWPDDDMRQFVRNYVLERSSGIGPTLQRMGVLFIFTLGALLWQVRGFPQAMVVRVFILAMLLNASLVTSTIWFVLGCCTALWEANRKLALATESAPEPV